MKRSWKTTVGGLLALLGAALLAAPDTAPGAEYLKPWATTLSAIGAGIIGLFSRDHNVSSEAAGVKPNETVQPQQNP